MKRQKQRVHKDLQGLYQEAPIGLCSLDTNLRYLQINDWLAALNGLPVEAHLGRTIREVLPDVAAGVEQQLRKVIETGEPIIDGRVDAETPAHPGVVRNFQHHYYPNRSEGGRIVGVSCVVEDISERRRAEEALRRAHDELEARVEERTATLTVANRQLEAQMIERRQAEAALQESHARFRGILDIAHEGIISIDAKERILIFNQGAARIFGYAPDEVLGQSMDILLPERARHRHSRHIAEFAGSTESARRMGDRQEIYGRRKTGEEFPAEASISKLEVGGERIFTVVLRDITERKQAEEGLRELTGRLITAQEQERARIARELHDDVNQKLALLAVDLELLGQTPPHSPAETTQQTRNLSAQVKAISSDVHRLSHRLHPSKIEQLGLVAAMKSLCRELSLKYDVRVQFSDRDVQGPIPEDIALCLYRIVQEALANVVKHSSARDAWVELVESPTAIHLRISDPGKGFNPNSVKGSEGLGLVSMQERVHLVGGEIAIDSQPAKGARINVRVPLPSAPS